MLRIPFVLLAVVLLAVVQLQAAHATAGSTFYVAPHGKGGAPGSKEQPLATLAAAREAAIKAGEGPHRIVVLPGEYFLIAPLELDARDSGLTIEAQPAGGAVLHGGEAIAGWRKDGERFWSAEVAGVKEGTRDFRALVVNGRMPPRARLPESGTFTHKGEWKVPWLTSVGGGWERKPTDDELTIMPYDPKDVPPTLDVKNAELRLYHMWDESLVGLARNDASRGVFVYATKAVHPPGAFGVKKYALFNTREGMTRPGQWYLDRSAGRIVYWPLEGEDMTKAKVVAPRLERIVRIAGDKKRAAERITLRGLVLSTTTTPLKSGGFGAYAFDGALGIADAVGCTIENVEIRNVGGQGIVASRLVGSRIVGCHVHHTGACGLRIDGVDSLLERNHVHHVGVYYPSAIALTGSSHGAQGLRIVRNEVHDTPYSGIVGSGGRHLIEENLIYRVMLELHDGGAIYGGMTDSVLRGNVVRDVVKIGEGYGVSSYYLDEGARDCVVERNVSVGVERPIHMHIARNIAIRDNVFLSDGDMTLSFARSSGCTFERNTLWLPGKLNLSHGGGVSGWAGNRIFRTAAVRGEVPQGFTIEDARPAAPPAARRTYGLQVLPVVRPPALDGEIESDEWPGASTGLDRAPTRELASGAPVLARAAYDDTCLYIAVNMVTFDIGKLRRGRQWGSDDGLEVALRGVAGGQPATFLLRGFVGGEVEAVVHTAAVAQADDGLRRAVRLVEKTYGKSRGGWRAECAIPWAAVGLKPAAGLKLPFNLTTYRSEDGVWRGWEGNPSKDNNLDQAGWLQLK